VILGYTSEIGASASVRPAISIHGIPLNTRKQSVAHAALAFMTAARFQALWRRCLVPGATDKSREICRELFDSYSEPHRRYHTCRHINFCLEQFDWARAHMSRPDAVELAVWFHDLIYDTTLSDNELRSAQRFVVLAGASLDPEVVGEVYDIILATYHRERPGSADAQYMVDIDLSSFGLPWDEFRQDSVAVRAEFPEVPDAEFFAGQLKFLRGLLARESIYATTVFREANECAARENIVGYIRELEAKGFR
jgi:predicted metal-dependent HD superfamily phosphohydrolase